MRLEDILKALRCIPCFAPIRSETLQKVATAIIEKSYQKGEIIFSRDEPCFGLFILKKGAVKLFRLSLDGKENVIRVARQGECLDCVPLVAGGFNPVSAQAIAPSEAYWLPHREFHCLFEQEPVMARQIARMLALKLRSFLGRFEDLNECMEVRVGRLLVELARGEDGEEKLVCLSQEELACLAGVSRQRLNMYLSFLEKQGAIHKRRGEICIVRPELLQTKDTMAS